MTERISAAEAARAARKASYLLAAASGDLRNNALRAISRRLKERRDEVFAANREDLLAAQTAGIAQPVLDRLRFDAHKLEDICRGIEALSELPDPIGQRQIHRELADGLVLTRVSCPIGVIGVIFESRPDALVQIGTLCVKSGNCVLLKGGSEARKTNAMLFSVLEEAGRETGLPEGWAALLETRNDVTELLSMDQDVDLLIPRGSGAFVRYIMEHTNIPVLGHSEGVCHVYLDAGCAPEMAARIAKDAKTQYPSACNAAETILWHKDAAAAMLETAQVLQKAGVRMAGDQETVRLLSEAGMDCGIVAEDGWNTE